MQTEEMIPASEFCTHHNIQLSFISSLQQSGLIEIIQQSEEVYVPLYELPRLEKIVRLYEMDINLEGIETINYLLQRMDQLQQQIATLNAKLAVYE